MPKSTGSWQKGESGNPGGRPRNLWTFKSLYQEELERVLKTTDGNSVTAKKAVAKRLVDMAIDGDINAIKELANRIDGVPKPMSDADIEDGGKFIIDLPKVLGLVT